MQIQSGLSFGSFNANPMPIQNFDPITNAKLGPRPQLGAHCQLAIGIVCAVGDDDVEVVETDYHTDDDDKSDKNINGWTHAIDSDGNSESDLMHEF